MSDLYGANADDFPGTADAHAIPKKAAIVLAPGGPAWRDYTIFGVDLPPVEPLTDDELWGARL